MRCLRAAWTVRVADTDELGPAGWMEPCDRRHVQDVENHYEQAGAFNSGPNNNNW